jgi:hypothetical protein
MLAGMWVLVLLPLMDVLNTFGWAARVRVPDVLDYGNTGRTLSDSLVSWPGVYQPLAFCIGVVLLFSKERGRRRNKLDWTRRWGVICSYVVLLLTAVPILFIGSLVLAGISALFMAMPLKYQPGVTHFFAQVSTTYLRYGPSPKDVANIVLVAFSSIAILLACAALFDALRSSGPKRPAAILLAPLAFFALAYFGQAAVHYISPGMTSPEIFHYGIYFRPELLAMGIADLPAGPNVSGPELPPFLGEAVKWCVVLAIAVWLSIAQLTAWGQRKKASTT